MTTTPDDPIATLNSLARELTDEIGAVRQELRSERIKRWVLAVIGAVLLAAIALVGVYARAAISDEVDRDRQETCERTNDSREELRESLDVLAGLLLRLPNADTSDFVHQGLADVAAAQAKLAPLDCRAID